jgi:hypothetical protein
MSIFRNRSSQPNAQPQPEKPNKATSPFSHSDEMPIAPPPANGNGGKHHTSNGTTNRTTHPAGNGHPVPTRPQEITTSPATSQTYPGTQANNVSPVSKPPQDDITSVISVLSSYTPPPEFKKVREETGR